LYTAMWVPTAPLVVAVVAVLAATRTWAGDVRKHGQAAQASL